MSTQGGKGGGSRARATSSKSQDQGWWYKQSRTFDIVLLSQLMLGYQVKISKCLLGHDQWTSKRGVEDWHYSHLILHPVCFRSGKTYSVVETGSKELTVKGINNQHNKTYQFDRSLNCTILYQNTFLQGVWTKGWADSSLQKCCRAPAWRGKYDLR